MRLRKRIQVRRTASVVAAGATGLNRLFHCLELGAFCPLSQSNRIRVTQVFALKGRSILAQGNALGTTDNIDIAAL